MKYHITKLDRRHNGNHWFKYSVRPNTYDKIVSAKELVELRNWCWEHYGASAEPVPLILKHAV